MEGITHLFNIKNDAIKKISLKDAIKELPGIPLPFENWKKLGVEMISCNEFETRF